MLISGQAAFVTGGGSGLGAATARHFASQGAKVAILDFDIDRARTVAEEIGGFAVQADVSDEAAVGAALDEAIGLLGKTPRAVVNCAGVGFAARIVGREGKLSFDTFEKTLKVNLFGTFNVMSHAARRLMDVEPLENGERGVIVNTASVAFEDGQLGQAAYSASKGGIAAMCLPAAREFAQHGIRVMAIAPGLFRTPMMEGLPEEVSAKITANIPFPPRLGEPEEFALLAGHIVTNPFLNGTTIRLDGAVRLPPR
ncbi:3-oxoacyl-[acyl-carrier-protein] reductase FabG [Labrenzia sp. THAF191b]|uniref:SDR family NAD(P)-dependent oxidoreductase n=1 Tax=unclassified Labrenzia TaxID=2648686 RepID=UPI0012684A6E|nr:MULTISPECIES: SDR family NAD(P)-dependent oxidoreductase [unclassified Labrenzia]QFS98238.1 3-oxoacyl-[acyl-carrier-protein] reductase FabG [Labrenzia sp. THAF191b]QFT04552.1 3-oxoacyl-[acyl-carrier-protein] reductase FabG [Labrenzia sp. THAF191a]QFT16096.1 3-oxoacyl-[acyl-carrier-protein] reductase FabG [Labrenzia sp. THAF187b]